MVLLVLGVGDTEGEGVTATTESSEAEGDCGESSAGLGAILDFS